jgi:hypothetical protein
MPLPRIRYRAASVTNGETVETAIRQRGGLAADRLAARAQHDAQAQFVSAPKRAAAALDASPGRASSAWSFRSAITRSTSRKLSPSANTNWRSRYSRGSQAAPRCPAGPPSAPQENALLSRGIGQGCGEHRRNRPASAVAFAFALTTRRVGDPRVASTMKAIASLRQWSPFWSPFVRAKKSPAVGGARNLAGYSCCCYPGTQAGVAYQVTAQIIAVAQNTSALVPIGQGHDHVKPAACGLSCFWSAPASRSHHPQGNTTQRLRLVLARCVRSGVCRRQAPPFPPSPGSSRCAL